MKKATVCFLLFCLGVFPAWAEDVISDSNTKETTAITEEEKLNAFGYPDKSLVAIIDNTPSNDNDQLAAMPSCDNPKLIEQVLKVLQPYLQNDQGTIIEKRRIALLRKRLHKFVDLDSEVISPKEDLAAADRLLELKINNKLNYRSIRLCRSDLARAKNNVYLVMYFADNKLMVEILNFTNGEELKFNFEPEV